MRYFIWLGTLVISNFAIASGNSIAEADKFRSLILSHRFKVVVEEKKSGDSSEFEVSMSGKNSLLIQTKPANSINRKLLMKNDDLWLFTPGSKRPIRVTLDQRLAGDVSNGDILRTDFKDDYSATRLLVNRKDAPDNIEIFELIKKSDGAAYQKIHYFLDKKNHKPLKAVFYAASGKELKTAEYLKFKKILGQEICIMTVITDRNTHEQTTMKNFGYALVKFDSSYFNKDALAN